jgi:hypothetical protein
LGRSPIRLAPRDAIDNEFFRMADEAKFAQSCVLIDRGVVSTWSADSRRAITHESVCQIGLPNDA